MNKLTLSLMTGTCGLFAGVLLGGGVKDLGKTIAMGGLMTVPAVALTHLVVDGKAQERVNEIEEKSVLVATELTKAKSQLVDIERSNRILITDLEKLRQQLKASESDRASLSVMLSNLNPVVAKLESELAVGKKRIVELEGELEQYQADCEEWESQFDVKLQAEADKRFQEARRGELEKIFFEHDQVTQEAMALFRRLQSWAVKVGEGHQAKAQIIRDLASAYNQNLDELGETVEQERSAYLTQIELLNEKVGRLQHQLNGDLVEPVYGQFGFNPEGKIANSLAEWLWNHRQIPLKVTGVESNSDGSILAGYTYPRSMPVEALIEAIEKDSPLIARNLGLYALQKPEKLKITDCLVVKIRRDRPHRKTDKGSLYRSREEFVKFILSQPVRLRIIGEPGAGKTPSVAVLLGHILSRGFLEANTPNGRKLPYCVVESCNPLAGISVKNGAELDFCLKWDSGSRGFKGLAQEYQFRKNPANADYKNQVGYIWVADEIDNSMADLSKDEAKPFKDSLKDGGHVNLGVIVMGQSANVSTSKGLSIDDQKMMTNIYIDPVSIRTFLTQYGERFYSKKAVEKALATLEELELEIE